MSDLIEIDWDKPIEGVSEKTKNVVYHGTRDGFHVVSYAIDEVVSAGCVDKFGRTDIGGQFVRNVPRKRVGWASVYPSQTNVGFRIVRMYGSRDEAVGLRGHNAIATIKIEFEEGEGL